MIDSAEVGELKKHSAIPDLSDESLLKSVMLGITASAADAWLSMSTKAV